MIEYQIVVVDASPKRWPRPEKLLKVGVPLAVALRYAQLRRTMGPAGQRRKLKARLN